MAVRVEKWEKMKMWERIGRKKKKITRSRLVHHFTCRNA